MGICGSVASNRKRPNPRYFEKAGPGVRTEGKAADSCPTHIISLSCILVICYFVGTTCGTGGHRMERSAEEDSGRLRGEPSLNINENYGSVLGDAWRSNAGRSTARSDKNIEFYILQSSSVSDDLGI